MTLLQEKPSQLEQPVMPPTGSWFDLYPKGRSKDELYTPESTRHPAKMSLPLCRRIIQELLEYRLLSFGGLLADPFGGRGSTAIEWCKLDRRNRAITCELEQPFIDMSFANRKHAEGVLKREMEWAILKGDSRAFDVYLADYMGVMAVTPDYTQALAAITSPPYGKGVIGSTSEKGKERLRKLTQDPTSSLYGRDPDGEWFKAMCEGYHWSPGNIDLAPIDSDYAALEAAVGSPPYEDSLCSDDPVKRGGLFKDPKRGGDPSLTGNYNGSYTQAAVGSPPFEAQSGGDGPASRKGMIGDTGIIDRHAAGNANGKHGTGYAENKEGQIGVAKGETYASMCRDVYRALHSAGIPTVVLVTKNPVKDQKLKRLDLLTIRLMEEAGYQLMARRRAYLWQTVGELAARGVTIERPAAPKGKLDQMYWDKWDERPYGEISFFNIVHLQAGRRAPSQFEDVLFFSRR
jgi:hypothetical protein